MEYVLKTKNVNGEEMFFEKLSTLGCPIDDKHLVCAKRLPWQKH